VCRAYDPDEDATALWACKQEFERELGGNTGDEEKTSRYESKLTEQYRDRYLEWVARCVSDSPGCLQVAPAADRGLDGYVFVLPERLAMIWDAAVLNELFVRGHRRGDGTADALLSAAVEHVESQSLPLDRLVLDVDPENERAKAFYGKHGFDSWGELVARELD
jgi:GNAT superfamily N-acetyltransferase